jgi:hypothetical protein
MIFTLRFYFTTCTLSSWVCVFFRTVVSLRMTYPRSKHVALLNIQVLISKYSCVMTDTNCMYFIIITTQWDVTYSIKILLVQVKIFYHWGMLCSFRSHLGVGKYLQA